MAVLESGVVLLLIISLCSSQKVHPSRYTISPLGIVVNGSSPTGHCSDTGNTASGFTCNQPSTSVLFDDLIPTLTGLDGHSWASRLLATNDTSTKITLEFPPGQNPDIARAEVWFFNCPEWGQQVSIIALQNNQVFPTITSCESLVRICVPCTMNCNKSRQTLSIDTTAEINPVLIAEIRLYVGNNSFCPNDTILPSPENTNSTPRLSTTMSGNMDKRNVPALPTIFAVVLSLLFILVSVAAAFLIIWRCYSAKRKRCSNTSALGEESRSRTNPQQPTVSLYEQVIITDQSHLDSSHARDRAQLQERALAQPEIVEDDMDGYSVITLPLKNCYQESSVVVDNDHTSGIDLVMERQYAEVDQQNKTTDTTANATDYTLPNMAVDHLYAHVNKNRESEEAASTEAKAISQLYAQVDKKRPAEATTTNVNEVYAQVDKKRKKTIEESGVEDKFGAPQLSSEPYHPTPPQIPPKSDLLLQDEKTDI